MHKMVENQVRISVRDLVEFVLRSGDLDNRRSAVNREAMREGSRIHRKIQKRMGAGYQAEVAMKMAFPAGNVEIVLEGRADGVMTETDGSVTIDEIKGMYQDVTLFQEPLLVHRAQAVCYAYMYAVSHGMEQMGIQMTYCNIETEETRRFREVCTMERLEDEVQSYIREYAKWAQFLYEHRKKRNASIKGLEFPYPYRKGQRDLVVAVYRSMIQGRNLFIQAPTGIGKTLSTVFPAVKAVGEGWADKIFYLTAKTITRSVAQESFQILRARGMDLSSVTITAKEKLCAAEEMECNPAACERAKGHFDRVNAAVYDLITHEEEASREVIFAYAQKYQVCPFEMCLDVTYWMDAVICDYNYAFDPNVKLQRYFADGVNGDYLFLVDEAHNLVERAREMYSARLLKEEIMAAKRLYRGHDGMVKKLERCNRALLALKRECERYRVLPEGEGLGALMVGLESLYGELEKFRDRHPGFEPHKEASEFFFLIRDFLNTYDRMDDHYRVYTELLEDGSFMVKLLCVNPAFQLKECLDKGISTIFFSATMLPIQYYKELLSGNQEEYAVYAGSPFEQKKRLLCVACDVSSRYTRRNRREFERILSYIESVVLEKTGNYLVFFPSYSYMEQVFAIAMEREEPYEILRQDAHMTEDMREEFLEHFETDKEMAADTSLVGFCVTGGIFSEGIDLREDRLIGVIVVGTGLPQVCTEREILKEYYDEEKRNGFDFAYRFPGMNKVLQAAGRLIRTMDDRGVIVLLDDRFLTREYVEQFPMEWDDYVPVRLSTVGEEVKHFWERDS